MQQHVYHLKNPPGRPPRTTSNSFVLNRVGIELVEIDLNLEDERAVLGLDFQCT
jgi:hypothetical protein